MPSSRKLLFRTTRNSLELVQHNPTSGDEVVAKIEVDGVIHGVAAKDRWLYVGRGPEGLAVYDIKDVEHPTEEGRIPLRSAVIAVALVDETLLVELASGQVVLCDLAEPRIPRCRDTPLTAQVPNLTGSNAQSRRELPLTANRFYGRISPSLTIVTSDPDRLLVLGSLTQSLGYAYEPSGGVWAGGDLNPFVFPALSTVNPAVSALLTLGYSGQGAAIGGMIGISSSVFGDDKEALRIVGMLAGLSFRVGNTNGAHLRMRLAWDVFPFIPVPITGELDINIPVNQRFGVNFNVLGDVGLLGGLATVGLQYYRHARASRKGAPLTVFTVSAGATVSFLGAAGPAVSLAIEPRW